jgi:hypothetical protein
MTEVLNLNLRIGLLLVGNSPQGGRYRVGRLWASLPDASSGKPGQRSTIRPTAYSDGDEGGLLGRTPRSASSPHTDSTAARLTGRSTTCSTAVAWAPRRLATAPMSPPARIGPDPAGQQTPLRGGSNIVAETGPNKMRRATGRDLRRAGLCDDCQSACPAASLIDVRITIAGRSLVTCVCLLSTAPGGV